MYNVAILGCENSHANAFLNLKKEGKYQDVNFIGVYSNEPEASKKLSEEFGVPVLESYTDAVGKVDAIIITARDGKYHYEYAKPYLDSGIPMFIDKPITTDSAVAVEFMKEAKAKGVKLCGGSVCKFYDELQAMKKRIREEEVGELKAGTILAPLDINSVYGGFFFYAQHMVQMMQEAFGYDIKRVSAIRNGNKVNVLADYGDYTVNGIYSNTYKYYYCGAFCQEEVISSEISFRGGYFECEFQELYNLLTGGEMKETYEEFISPVFVMEAIKKSYEKGEMVEVATIPEV